VPLDQGRYAGKLAWPSIIMRVAVWVLPAASSFLLIVRLADVLFPLWQLRRQTLHDIVARTQVVKIG
jgi:uncharacterized RDD family membrane protein YckC